MTFRTVNNTFMQLQALEKDNWPEDGVKNGAKLYVLDTGNTYVFHEDDWVPKTKVNSKE